MLDTILETFFKLGLLFLSQLSREIVFFQMMRLKLSDLPKVREELSEPGFHTSLSYIKVPSITKRDGVYKKNSFICIWLADEAECSVTEVAG